LFQSHIIICHSQVRDHGFHDTVVQALLTLHISIHVASVYIICPFSVQFDKNVGGGVTVKVFCVLSQHAQFVGVIFVVHAVSVVIVVHDIVAIDVFELV
jgi:hypothetical protein